MNGENLGRVMWMNRKTGYTVNIYKDTDSLIVLSLKTIISDMIRLVPSRRLIIKHVLEELSYVQLQQEEIEAASEREPELAQASGISKIQTCDISPSSTQRESKKTSSSSSAKAKNTCAQLEKQVSATDDGEFLSKEKDTHHLSLLAMQKSVLLENKSGWEHLSDMPTAHPYEQICFCTLSDGILAIGGISRDNIPSRLVHHFSLHTRNWLRLKNMPAARSGTSAAVLPHDVVLVVGGSLSCEKFYVMSNKWRPATSLPESLFTPLVASAVGQVYVVPHDDNIQGGIMHEYQPSTNDFACIDLPTYIRSTAEACLFGHEDLLYLLGGEQNLATQYNTHTQQWTELTTPPSRYFDPVFRVYLNQLARLTY